MILTKLNLTHYRNLTSASIEMHPKLTVFLGLNGVGKTNILEAIHLLSFPRSFRGHKDELLKQWNEDFCRVEGVINRDDQMQSIVYFYDKTKKLQLDGQVVSATDYVGQFLSVLFAPEEVDLLAGSPSRRRAFLDAHLSLLSPQYFYHLLHYNKAVKQRNKLLSNSRTLVDEMDYWNDLQASHGSAIIEARQNGINNFNQLLFPKLQIRYTSSLLPAQDSILSTFQHKQTSMYERERAVGHSLLGPHRDDWLLEELSPDVRNLGIYGSRGEQRMAVIELKQAELSIIHAQTGSRAILLLDDVLSELDAGHQQELLSALGDQQSILTTASLSDVPPSLLKDALVYTVEPGQIALYQP